mmetsp:Transcript_92609/g.220405  ORF Transcript_92609/g.220405 Transcript_92609/m.220405 type:complete len:212 (+) Transcript_92609:787-1422(+)
MLRLAAAAQAGGAPRGCRRARACEGRGNAVRDGGGGGAATRGGAAIEALGGHGAKPLVLAEPRGMRAEPGLRGLHPLRGPRGLGAELRDAADDGAAAPGLRGDQQVSHGPQGLLPCPRPDRAGEEESLRRSAGALPRQQPHPGPALVLHAGSQDGDPCHSVAYSYRPSAFHQFAPASDADVQGPLSASRGVLCGFAHDLLRCGHAHLGVGQ